MRRSMGSSLLLAPHFSPGRNSPVYGSGPAGAALAAGHWNSKALRELMADGNHDQAPRP